jgi:hypothetical protein
MKIEINLPKEFMNDMVAEQEMRFSSCFMRRDEIVDEISQEFLTTILTEYKLNYLLNKSLNQKNEYLKINISKTNGK